MGQLPVHCLKWTFVPHFKSTNEWENDIYESMSVRFITVSQKSNMVRFRELRYQRIFMELLIFYSNNKPPQFCALTIVTNSYMSECHVIPDIWLLRLPQLICSTKAPFFRNKLIDDVYLLCTDVVASAGFDPFRQACLLQRTGSMDVKRLSTQIWNAAVYDLPSAVYHDQPALQYQHLPTVAMSMSWCHGAKEMPLRTPWNSWWHGWIAC